MNNNDKTRNLLIEVANDLSNIDTLWQLGTLLLCLGLAWLITRAIRNRQDPEKRNTWQSGINRTIYPITALLLIVLAKAILGRWFHDSVLQLAVPLLLSLALIRFTVYILQHAFTSSKWLVVSEKFISISIWSAVALHITGFGTDILTWLDEFHFAIGKQKVSLLTILQGILSVAIVMLLALWLASILEKRIMAKTQMDMNLRVVLARILRPALVFIGILIALPMAGIDLTVLSVFGGALGIGIGFGLQKITSNYISGFIVLLDRSIRIGDLLTVNDRYGTVTDITARYLVLKGLDGTEAIIPNEALIISTVLNHSYSNHEMRVAIPVQISYESPLEKAMEIMLNIAIRHERVIQAQPPKVFLKSFGDNGIDLELNLWISDPEEGQSNLRSEINLAIWREFQQHEIEIPFPQRVVKLLQ